MKITLLRLIGFSTALGSAAVAGTHVGIGLSFGVPAPVYVRRAPPVRVVERVVIAPPPAPGPGYVWLPGRYSWTGGQWVWMAGAWVLPPRSDARWIDGNWNTQTQQWIEGHWEVPAPTTTVVMPSPAPMVVVQAPTPPVAATTEIVLPDAPPPPPEGEVRVVAPGPGYVWIDGYWGWENGRRQWYRGHWEQPPRGYRHWVQPHWDHRPHGYVYIRGYWR